LREFSNLNSSPYLETSGRPVDEADVLLTFQYANCSVYVLWNDISSVQHAAAHELTTGQIALNHDVAVVESFICQVGNRV
jgi:hypothetical protein